MKYEWRKSDKNLYIPTLSPAIVNVPQFTFLELEGNGNPNHENFQHAIRTLYSLSYAIKMMPKKGVVPNGYFDYTVFPLEGVWDLDEVGRTLPYLDKNHLVYQLMIRQPSFVTRDVFNQALSLVQKKGTSILLPSVRLVEREEGVSVQCLHVGSYDDEPFTFAKMDSFCKENGYRRLEKTHREIYLSDARRTPVEKLKTVLRYRVTQSE